MTDWHAAPGDSPHTLQYRGCGKEGKYIHFTPDFLLNDALTAGYGSRGKRDRFSSLLAAFTACGRSPGWGSNPPHSSGPSLCRDSARSLPHWATRERRSGLKGTQRARDLPRDEETGPVLWRRGGESEPPERVKQQARGPDREGCRNSRTRENSLS